MKKMLLAAFILVLAAGVATAQSESRISIHATPGVDIPLPLENVLFKMGAGVNTAFEYRIPTIETLSVFGDFTYSLIPITNGENTTFITAAGGLGITLPRIGRKLSTSLFAGAGYYYGIVDDTDNSSGGNLFLTGGLRLGWPIGSAYDIGIEARYKALFDGLGGLLHHTFSVGLSNTINIHIKGGVKIFNIQFQEVYPVLYKYYDTNSVGKVKVKNGGSSPIKDITVTVFVDKYMDNPTVCDSPKTLRGGEDFEIDLYALFSEKVLDITESTVVSARVEVTYQQNEKEYNVEQSVSMRLFDRNAMTWDDDRKAAAFVNYKDPVVIELGKTFGHVIASSGPSVDPNLSTAMAMHEAFGNYGIKYVVDPTTPFTEYSENVKSVDFLQFPYSTLKYKSGDCDDLSILYASVLQSVGIETAFITIPGHIFMAFALKLPPDEARRAFSDQDDVIIMNDKAWIPIEITMVGESFLKAWKVGALEWKENNATGKANFFPLQEAWKTYEPVGFSGDSSAINFIDENRVAAGFRSEMKTFIDREIFSQTEPYKNRLKKNKSAKLYTQLGNVYARYGRTEEARNYYQQALNEEKYYPALLNIGNLYFMDKNFSKALDYYRQAERIKENDWLVQLQISRVYNEMGNFKTSTEYFNKMKKSNPAMADHYSYLDMSSGAASRASNKGAVDAMVWAEEADE